MQHSDKKRLGMMLTSYALLVAYFMNGHAEQGLRFVSPWANYLFFVVVFSCVALLCALSISYVMKSPVKISLKIPVVIFYALLAISASVVLLFSFPMHGMVLLENDGRDIGFEQIHDAGRGVKIYRSNGGATTAYGIDIRQEKEILPGLLLVKKIFSAYPMEDVEYHWQGDVLHWRERDGTTKGQAPIH